MTYHFSPIVPLNSVFLSYYVLVHNIRHLWDLDISVFTVSELLRALDDMPHLESLRLYGEALFAYDDDDTIDT
ncbi:hypothetical protein CVT25_012834 [Psilocybe cyanescens]|uniref:Uncharacterized protein n=1 Tax=Psilocybe cyanescens TaxID=93625 RepID=A0A409XFD9_PSICY|nr:hypothetical protein CVT25_012834 [Psilocybe cyanescens]